MKRLLTGAVAGVLALLLMGGPAYAHFCTNASRSETGSSKVAANSQGWMSIDDFLSEFVGLCDDGVAHVMAGLEGTGWENLSIHRRAVMAGGTYNNEDVGHVTHDGRGVDHLTEAEFAELEELLDPLIGEGFGICNG